MDENPFKFHDDYGLKLPLLVLATKSFPKRGKTIIGDPRYRFKAGREFVNLQHQTAGHACHQVYMQATVLKPREPVKIEMLADAWLETDEGCFGSSLDAILKYREQIKALFGLDCNRSFRDFEEGIYPIDCSPEALGKICEDELPEELDDLIEFGEGTFEKMWGCVGRWSIYVLGENCD